MSFLFDSGDYIIPVFRLRAVFRNLYLTEEYPLASIAHSGLRKVVLRAETSFAILYLYQKKVTNLNFLCFLLGKNASVSQAYFLV